MYVRVMFDAEWVAGLDADGVCVAVGRAHAVLVAAEAREFFLAAHWADLHSGEAVEDQRRASGRRVLPGMERGRRLGADGTPLVAEFAPMEFGALVGMGYVAAAAYLRDALNVRHRHPAMWAALGRTLTADAASAGSAPRVWQARRVARLCAEAGLDRDQARWVDAVTTPYAGSLPWSRFTELVEAKIIEADPAEAEARRKAAAAARFVRTGQSTEHGLKLLVAKANAGDVILFVAMVDRIAQVLALHGDPDPVDVRRSKAIGILATPARAVRMLQDAETLLAAAARTHPWPGTDAPDHPTDGAGGGAPAEHDDRAEDNAAGDGTTGGTDDHPSDSSDDAAEAAGDAGQPADHPDDPQVVGEADVHPSQNDADDPKPAPDEQRRPCPTCAGAGRVDPRRLLPNATLYLHLAEESLNRDSRGVARFEGVGPITIEQVREFLGHTNVRVVPVVDLADQKPVDGYETPAPLRDAVHLRHPVCIAPWGTNRSRRKDMEHLQPYRPPDHGGPPGQTSMDNLAPLSRFPHRAKTHGHWSIRQPQPGVYEWRSPHGHTYRVDHHGTHPLGKTDPQGASPAETPATQSQHTEPPHTEPPPQTDPELDVRALRGRKIRAMEIYQTDCPIDLSDWQHSA